MTTFLSRFADFVFVSGNHKTLQDKFDLAVSFGTVLAVADQWIMNEENNLDYQSCDFIAPGGFPGFLKEEDAKACVELMETENTIVQHCQREGVEYWILD